MASESTLNNSENTQIEQVTDADNSQQMVEWKANELAMIFDLLENKYDKITQKRQCMGRFCSSCQCSLQGQT